jgi:hypothetical protein
MTFGVLVTAVLAANSAQAAETAPENGEKHLLRYKFQKGEQIVWKVEHRARVKTTVSGTTQTADTTSISAKRWEVSDVKPDGSVTFIHSVDYVDMRQQMSDRDEERFDSRTGDKPSAGFTDVAKAVKVPLTVATIDARGRVLKREEKLPQPNAHKGQMTIQLPEDAVAVGANWNEPFEVDVSLKDGTMKRIKGRQHYTLEKVENNLATIRVETQWLTPNRDPAMEAQLIQRDTTGSIRFDIAAGRVVQQQVDIDRDVVGFQGAASSMHYNTRFTEELLPAEARTAATPKKSK